MHTGVVAIRRHGGEDVLDRDIIQGPECSRRDELHSERHRATIGFAAEPMQIVDLVGAWPTQDQMLSSPAYELPNPIAQR